MIHQNIRNKPRRFWLFLPVLGIALFVILYGMAAHWYPGGSKFDKNAPGFDWLHNYWCDLLDVEAQNGAYNAARPLAAAAMAILCASLALFWQLVPAHFALEKRRRRIIRIAGSASMTAALLLLAGFHETGIAAAGLFGILALMGTMQGLYRSGFAKLYRFGLFCMFLVLVNNFIYYTQIGLPCLVIVQKISFVVFLGWVAWMCLEVGADEWHGNFFNT